MTLNRRKGNQRSEVFALGLMWHVAIWIAVGLFVVGMTLSALWLAMGRPDIQSQTKQGVSPETVFDASKLALTVVAGIGGVVALVVAFRRQRIGEAEHWRQEVVSTRELTRLFTERFAQATEQLGSDHATVRVAGVYALTGLADDWDEGRQTCVDVLCAYLRMPYRLRSPLPEYETENERDRVRIDALRFAMSVEGPGRNSYPPDEEHQVRATIVSALRDRMNRHREVPWVGLNLNFTGAVFDDAGFDGFLFDDCNVEFGECVFLGETSFAEISVAGSRVWFTGAIFLGRLGFELAVFEDSELVLYANYADANFQACHLKSGTIHLLGPRNGQGSVSFVTSALEGGEIEIAGGKMTGSDYVAFSRSTISGTEIDIRDGEFEGGNVWFNGVTLSGGHISFRPRDPEFQNDERRMTLGGTEFSFDGMDIDSGSIRFGFMRIDGSTIHFDDLRMSGGGIRFVDVKLTSGSVLMTHPQITGGAVDLGELADTEPGRVITRNLGEYARAVPPRGTLTEG